MRLLITGSHGQVGTELVALAQAAEAHRAMEERGHYGKIVLLTGPEAHAIL